jgi:hypothetical protein
MNILLAIPFDLLGTLRACSPEASRTERGEVRSAHGLLIPWWGWANPNVSEDAWRYMAPAIGALMIVTGIALILFVPSN